MHRANAIYSNGLSAGIALPVVLILLFVMTLIGVATLRTTMNEEQMAVNTRLREIAFNAAETTLRYGEAEAKKALANIRGDVINTPAGDVNLFVSDSGKPDWPDISVTTHAGDVCTGGYCIPKQYHISTSSVPNGERWEDPDLDVWNTTSKHHEYSNFDDANLDAEGVFEAPKFIIEYMGDFPGESNNHKSFCEDPANPGVLLGNAVDWPYCQADPSYFRITARAIAGSGGRESIVMLQSTILIGP